MNPCFHNAYSKPTGVSFRTAPVKLLRAPLRGINMPSQAELGAHVHFKGQNDAGIRPPGLVLEALVSSIAGRLLLRLFHPSVTFDSCIVGRGGIRWSEELRADLGMGQYACGAPPIDVYNTVPSVLPLLVAALMQARLAASGPRCHS